MGHQLALEEAFLKACNHPPLKYIRLIYSARDIAEIDVAWQRHHPGHFISTHRRQYPLELYL